MKNARRLSSLVTGHEHGAALIVTLLIVVLFVVVVTGFLSTTRVEQMAARNFSYQTAARQMADLGLEQALAQMNAAIPAGASNVTTQPGRIVVDGTTNFLSSASSTNALLTNVYLNQGRIMHTNTDTNLFRLPLVPVTNTNGVLLGRYAYWVDDEGTKANLNSMLGAPRTNFVPRAPRYFDYRAVGTSGANDFAAVISGNDTSPTNPWPYFFTGKQIGLLSGVGPSVATRYLHSMSAGPGNMNPLPSWATDRRKGLNGEFIADPPIIVGGVEWWRNFLTNADGTTALLGEVDNVMSSVDRPMVTSLFGSGFVTKYGTDVLRQILVNINDWPVSAGTENNPGVTATTGAALTNTEGIPVRFLGLRRFIHLNEVAVSVFCASNSFRIQPQLFINTEMVNPYSEPWGDASEVVVEIDEFSFTGSYLQSGVLVPFVGGWPSPASITFKQRTTPADVNITSNQFYTNQGFVMQWDVWPTGAFSNVTLTSTVKIKSVKLLQWIGEPVTIRDWAASSDLPVWVFGSDRLVGATDFVSEWGILTSPPPHLNWSVANQTNVLGIAKNDPRVRTFASYASPLAAWQAVGGGPAPRVTLGSNNATVNFSSGTGLPGIANDPAGGATDIFSHPSFERAFVAMNSNEPYRTVMELGRVHTGLQWRTLQMRAQDAAERSAGHIPDWALLETFYTTNAPTKLNVNSLQQPATTNAMPAALAQRTAGLTRPLAAKALFTGGTAANASADGFAGASGMNAATADSLSTDIAAMAFKPGWGNFRATNPAFVTNAYNLVGEVLEISNVSDFSTTNDFIAEGRAAAFIDAISVSSDIFAIYSVGQAVDPAGRQVAEHRTRTLVRRDPAGRFEAILTEPLLAP